MVTLLDLSEIHPLKKATDSLLLPVPLKSVCLSEGATCFVCGSRGQEMLQMEKETTRIHSQLYKASLCLMLRIITVKLKLSKILHVMGPTQFVFYIMWHQNTTAKTNLGKLPP